ncbi:hypothetical protein [Brevibacillus daliensis]|uniref:hypothetical protein n=1 Tax=Brevibacillus daliensis TaxID=2892995 RepID=UPI001E56AADD|nr:hypothetical protein [Brevibacillus daliensis]
MLQSHWCPWDWLVVLILLRQHNHRYRRIPAVAIGSMTGMMGYMSVMIAVLVIIEVIITGVNITLVKARYTTVHLINSTKTAVVSKALPEKAALVAVAPLVDNE